MEYSAQNSLNQQPSEKNWLVFTVIVITYLFLIYCSKILLINNELYFVSYSGQMNEEQITHLVTENEKWGWTTYLLFPLIILVKIFAITSALSLAYYVSNNQWNLSKFFRIVIISESIFLIPIVIKIFWFSLVMQNYSIMDLQNFYPLSLSNIIKLSQSDSWLRYPMQLVNVFEILYIISLTVGMHKVTNFNMIKSGKMVVVGYGSLMAVWVLLITFLTISFS